MAVDSQDRIVLAGIFSTVTPASSHQATVLRYTSSLQADASFGTAGKATYAFLSAPGATSCPTGGSGTGCNVGGVAIQADDKIVVGGYRNAFTALAVARVNVDGTLDTTFGSSGVEYLTISGFTLYDNGSIDLDEDDGIWITGGAYQAGYSNRKTLLALLTPNGALDTSFGSTP
ncbi:MAG TPA: hypothetical protein VJR29_02765 [bacterium]|nr:hypothetical protein [bacterium]